jgi:hypothetical protein
MRLPRSDSGLPMPILCITRRELMMLVAGAAASPLAARAQQQTERHRLVAAMIGWSNVGSYHANFAAFVERLAQLGWPRGRGAMATEESARALRLPRTRRFCSAQTISFDVMSGCAPISTRICRECFSNGEVLPPRRINSVVPSSRKRCTHRTAELKLTSNSSPASRRDPLLPQSQ